MEAVMKMAGYCAAHAVQSVRSGEILIPIVGTLKVGGRQQMTRLAMGSSAEAMARGEQCLNELKEDDLGVVFIKDAMVTLDSGKTDCLMLEIRFAEDTRKKIQYLIPYRNAQHASGFAVHPIGVDALQRSLSRLTLAFVLKREQDVYGFAIPLFVQQFEPGELGLFLHQEMREAAVAHGKS